MSNFKPILACDADLDNLHKLPYPLGGFLKYDGVRVIHHNGFYGRSMKLHKNPYLQGVFNKPEYFGFDSEGLVTAPGDPMACTLTSGAFMRQKDKPSEDKYVKVDATCHVFDDFTDPAKPFIDRYNIAADRVTGLLARDPSTPLAVFPMRMIRSFDDLQEFEAEADAGNHEGLILRALLGPYKFGRCTAKEGIYLRIKRFEEREFIIEDFEEGFTNTNEAKKDALGHTERSTKKDGMIPNGEIASLLGRDLETDKPVKVAAGKMTVAEAKHWFQNFHELKGQIGKYQVFNKGTGNFEKPRFPTFQGLRSKEDMSK
jgi:DNA ligase-1